MATRFQPRTALYLCLLFCLGAASPCSARNAAPSPVDDYLRTRRSAAVVPFDSMDEIRARPDRFESKLVEVRGTVKGVAEAANRATLVLGNEGTGDAAIDLQGESLTGEWSFLVVGARVRALCRVTAHDGLGGLELAAAVRENDAALAERKRGSSPAGRADSSAPPRLRPGKGGGAGPDDALRQAYGDGLRYFNPQLGEAAAGALAGTLIDVSRKRGLDARLVFAALVVEGAPWKVGYDQQRLTVNGQPGLKTVDSLSRDLARRAAANPAGPQMTVVKRALVDRGNEVVYPAQPGKPRGAEYAHRVLELYGRLTGIELKPVAKAASKKPAGSSGSGFEARWKARVWRSAPPKGVSGTWVGMKDRALAVFNKDSSGVFGAEGGTPGRWYVSGGFLEFRQGGATAFRGKWRVSDDGESLLLVPLGPGGQVAGSMSFLRR